MSERGHGVRAARRSRVWSHDPRKRSRVGLGVGFASMIDVVFLLLMYFLLTMDFREPEYAIGVAAPSLGGDGDPFSFPVEPIYVRVGEGVAVAELEGREIASSGLGEIAESLRSQVGVTILGDEGVQIVGTAGVAWDSVYAVLDDLVTAGFERVRLVEVD